MVKEWLQPSVLDPQLLMKVEPDDKVRFVHDRTTDSLR